MSHSTIDRSFRRWQQYQLQMMNNVIQYFIITDQWH